MERKMIATSRAPRAIGPYSQAVASSGLLFCSGQLGMDPDTGELADSLADQVSQALQNLNAVLAAAGAAATDVLRTTVYLTEMSDFAKMNEIYAGYFSVDPPARSTVAVKQLPKGALFELDAIAQLSG